MTGTVLPQGAGYGVGTSHVHSMLDGVLTLLLASRRYVGVVRGRPSSLKFFLGIGLFFSAFMLCLTAIQARYTAFTPKNSEEFTSASRSVKPGLIASGIVSAWTWAATLVRSTFFDKIFSVYLRPSSSKVVLWRISLVRSHYHLPHHLANYPRNIGISGPWWYGGILCC
jgi:hypothetical protein